ncbi:hypothetical protein Peur_019589 [Populus x canadensis]
MLLWVFFPSGMSAEMKAMAGTILCDCYSTTNKIAGKRRGPRLDWICCRFSGPQLNRDEEDEHGCSTSNDDVLAEMDIFILTLDLWKCSNWISK